MQKNDFISFNDGVVKIYSVGNISEPGCEPKEGLTLKYKLAFTYEKIGINRNYQALQAQVQITELISVPLKRNISTQDVAVIGTQQYKIKQVQHDKGKRPQISTLTLTELEAKYEFA